MSVMDCLLYCTGAEQFLFCNNLRVSTIVLLYCANYLLILQVRQSYVRMTSRRSTGPQFTSPHPSLSVLPVLINFLLLTYLVSFRWTVLSRYAEIQLRSSWEWQLLATIIRGVEASSFIM
jgi:hypothetical protein